MLIAFLGWAERAPSEPESKAPYLCAPVHTAARVALALQQALRDGAAEPNVDPRRFSPGATCERLVIRVAIAADD